MPRPDDARPPLFRRILGAGYERLPAIIQRMHETRGGLEAEGRVTVTRGTAKRARLLAELMDLPPAMKDAPARVQFTPDGEAEILRRDYDGEILETRQEAGSGRDEGCLVERIGPVTLVLRLIPCEDGLEFELARVRVRGLPLPRALWPTLEAAEFVEKGWYRFQVALALPLVGPVIRYEGRLKPKAAAKPDAA